MSVADNLEAGKYKNNFEVTGSTLKSKELCVLGAIPASKLTQAQFDEFKRLQAAHEVAKTAYRASLQKYREEDARLCNLFEADAAEECGLTDHPKRQMLWGKAWEHGHAYGLSEVWIHYQDLAELLKD